MPDEHLSTRLPGHVASGREGAVRGLLGALWSFLQHPAAIFEDHLTALEQHLRALERRLGGDLKTAVDTGVVTVEETVAGVEHRLEEDFKRAIRGRLAEVQARLETVKSRAVEDLKHELRRVVLMLTLATGCGMLALVAITFGLMAAWTGLKGFVGTIDASLMLAIAFMLASLVVFGLLRSALHRSQPHSSAKAAT